MSTQTLGAGSPASRPPRSALGWMKGALCASPKAHCGQQRMATVVFPSRPARCWWPANPLVSAPEHAPAPWNHWNLPEASLFLPETQKPRGGTCPGREPFRATSSRRRRMGGTGSSRRTTEPQSQLWHTVARFVRPGRRGQIPARPEGRRLPVAHAGGRARQGGPAGVRGAPCLSPAHFRKGTQGPRVKWGGDVGDLGQDTGGPSLRVTGQEAGKEVADGGQPCPGPDAGSPACLSPAPPFLPVPVGQAASAASHTLSTHVATLRPSRGKPNLLAGPSTTSGCPGGWGLAVQRSLLSLPGCGMLTLGPGGPALSEAAPPLVSLRRVPSGVWGQRLRWPRR